MVPLDANASTRPFGFARRAPWSLFLRGKRTASEPYRRPRNVLWCGRVKRLGRYTLERVVGVGGMAEVWQARALGPSGFEKVVAVKRVLRSLSADSEFVRMFAAEARLVAGLIHPNIVQVTDYAVEAADDDPGADEHFLAMEYVDGVDLAALLQRAQYAGRAIPTSVAILAARDIARALGCAHANGVVHRDVSPHNVMASRTGEIKVTDFGIAKVMSAVPRTAIGLWKGKLPYMSPEQALLKPLDGRSDLFSLGLVLYELLSGKRRNTGDTSEEIFSRLIDVETPKNEDLFFAPPEMRIVLRRSLALDPDERFPDARAMEAALSAALGAATEIRARQELAALVDALAPVIPIGAFDDAPIGMEAPSIRTALAFDPEDSHTVAAIRVPEPSHTAISVLDPDTSDTVPVEHRPRAKESGPEPRRRLHPSLLGIAIAIAGLFCGQWALRTIPAAPAPMVDAPTPPPELASDLARVERRAGRRPRAAAVERTDTGFLTVHAAPWCEVWIDGKIAAAETPMRRFVLPAERHTVVFRNRYRHFSTERSIRIAPGAETRLFVDVSKRAVRAD